MLCACEHRHTDIRTGRGVVRVYKNKPKKRERDSVAVRFAAQPFRERSLVRATSHTLRPCTSSLLPGAHRGVFFVHAHPHPSVTTSSFLGVRLLKSHSAVLLLIFLSINI